MEKYIDADKLIHDLEERIFAYSEGYAEGDDNRKDAIETLLKDVKYQYSLQQEQPEKPVPSDLEEAADTYASDGTGFIDTTAFRAFIAGAKWDRSQIMQEAVEGTVTCHNLNRYILVSGLDESLTYGDKVRIIVIPNTDEK